MVQRLSARQNSSCGAREKKITAFLSTCCVNCISSINFDFLLLTTPQHTSQHNLREKYRSKFSTTNSRIQEVHILCDAWPFIFRPFFTIPYQYFPVERLPVSRWYPQQKIIDNKKRSPEERIDKKRRLSCPPQTRRPSTLEMLELMFWYVNRSILQASRPRRVGGMPGRTCHIFLNKTGTFWWTQKVRSGPWRRTRSSS